MRAPLVCFSTLLLVGCVDSEDYNFDNLEQVQWSPTFALPLATGQLGLEDLLSPEDSATLSVREDGVFYFEYQEQFESQDLGELIDIPDVEENYYIQLPVPLVVPPNTSLDLPELSGTILLPSESEFHTLKYKAGQLQYTLRNTMDIPVSVKMVFPTITREDQSLEASAEVASDLFLQNLSLKDFTADLTKGNRGYNTIPFEIHFSAVNSTDQPIRLAAGDRVSASFSLTDQEFSYIDGEFGDLTIDIPEIVLDIGPFDEMLKYNLELAEMDLILGIRNQYGVPINLYLPEFHAVNGEGQILAIQTSPEPPVILEAAEEPGDEKITQLEVVNDDQLIQHDPEQIRVKAVARINERQGSGVNFLTDDANLVFDLAAEIPLIGSFRDVEIRDTLDADLRNSFEELNIKRMELKTELVNEFPFGGDFQIYLLNENQQVIDSLLLPGQTDIITSSKVDQEGSLQDPGRFNENISISQEKFSALQQTTQIIIVARLNSVVEEDDSRPAVRFKSQYRLYVELAALAEIESTITP